MKEYSEDIQNLIYYDKEAMDERVRLTDLKDAEESGIETGKKETTIEMVKKMLKDKLPIETISKYSGLTKKEILNLQ